VSYLEVVAGEIQYSRPPQSLSLQSSTFLLNQFLPFMGKDGIIKMVPRQKPIRVPSFSSKTSAGGDSIFMEEKQINEDFGPSGNLEEQMSDHPMNDLMEQALSFQKLRQGDIVDGQIVSVSPTEILVDVGAKSEGVVRGRELESLGREGLESLQVGHTLPVYIVRAEDRDGNLVLSIRRAEEEADWRHAEELHEAGGWFESSVAGFNKGGLIVRMGKLRGFVPASQLTRRHQGKQNQQPEERWARLVGTPIRVKIIEINRKRKRLILSERAALRQWREAQKAKLLEELREGEVRRGVVSSLSEFGAFVDLGGADGLVHLSELSWNRSAKPDDILEVGQEVEVYVLGVNQEKKRIALSLKRLEPEPWSTVESRYYVGQLVEGTITRLTNFGAFALVNDEIEGLIHVSELSNRRINHPQEIVHEGEKHVMRIIRIDPKRRRMGLSLMRVADPAYADLDWRAELAEAEASLEEYQEAEVSLEESEETEGPLEPEETEVSLEPEETEVSLEPQETGVSLEHEELEVSLEESEEAEIPLESEEAEVSLEHEEVEVSLEESEETEVPLEPEEAEVSLEHEELEVSLEESEEVELSLEQEGEEERGEDDDALSVSENTQE
jgi:small subunit ribosomal protein S1